MPKFNFKNITLQNIADITDVMDNFNEVENTAATSREVTDIDIIHRGTLIEDNSDLDDFITPGAYYCPAGSNTQTLSNIPPITAAFKLVVETLHRTDRILQTIIVNTGTPTIYYRINTGTWGNWYKSTIGQEPIKYKDYQFDLYNTEENKLIDLTTFFSTNNINTPMQTILTSLAGTQLANVNFIFQYIITPDKKYLSVTNTKADSSAMTRLLLTIRIYYI